MKYAHIFLICLIGITAILLGVVFTDKAVITFIILLIFYFIYKKTNQKKIFSLNILIYSTAVYLGLINYSLFEQAKVLIGTNPIELLLSGHPHWPRYLVSYPAIFVSDVFGLSVDFTFQLYDVILSLLMLSIINNLTPNLRIKNDRSGALSVMVISLLFLLLSTFMNGRLIAAYLGIALIFSAQEKMINNQSLRLKQIIYICIGFLLSTVSSGTMMVVILQISIGTLLIIMRLNKRSLLLKLVLLLSPFIFVIIEYVIVMVRRNLNYFGGGIQAITPMLKHGVGQVFYGREFLIPVIIFVFPFALLIFMKLYHYSWKNTVEMLPVIISLPFSALGALFGISTGTMMIPGLLALILHFLNKKKLLINKVVSA